MLHNVAYKAKSNIEISVGYNKVFKLRVEINIRLDTCTCFGMVGRVVYRTETRNRRLHIRLWREFAVLITGTVGSRSFRAPGGDIFTL